MPFNIFQPWPKIPRVENRKEIYTEKIDGTNACIAIYPRPAIEVGEPLPIVSLYLNGQGYNIWAQSRKQLIYPESDNYGFAAWVVKHAEELIALGGGHHFGEWWGNGINRNYDLKEKRFSLFNTKRWGPHNPNTPSCCSVVPTIHANSVEEAKQILIEKGSLAAPGYMRPEGVVVFETQTSTYWKGIIDK